MKSKYFYINVSQTLAVAGCILVALRYLDYQAEAVGIQKKAFRDRVFSVFKEG